MGNTYDILKCHMKVKYNLLWSLQGAWCVLWVEMCPSPQKRGWSPDPQALSMCPEICTLGTAVIELE